MATAFRQKTLHVFGSVYYSAVFLTITLFTTTRMRGSNGGTSAWQACGGVDFAAGNHLTR